LNVSFSNGIIWNCILGGTDSSGNGQCSICNSAAGSVVSLTPGGGCFPMAYPNCFSASNSNICNACTSTSYTLNSNGSGCYTNPGTLVSNCMPY